MSILFGHPTGNPNSHHAALAHFESGWLEALCVPWMPTPGQLRCLQAVPGLRGWTARLDRRCFLPLLKVPRIEGRRGEWWRMIRRTVTPKWANEQLSYEANDWLMRTMALECGRPQVTAVHAYEDCSLWQFEEAKRLGKACIYDMPIGYYPAWEETQSALARQYADWLPPGAFSLNRYVRPEQKRKEMDLADLVLAPSSFVQKTIMRFLDKKVALAPYGVDLDFWRPPRIQHREGPLRFIYAGQMSVRKGVPLLLAAWRRANLNDAELQLVGSWQLAESKKNQLPTGVTFVGSVSRESLWKRFNDADVFVFPTFFEGRALVLGEALACGLPVITTEASGVTDLVEESCGRIVPLGNEDALVESLRWFAEHEEQLPAMRRAARAQAETCTWEYYRQCVSEAVAPFV